MTRYSSGGGNVTLPSSRLSVSPSIGSPIAAAAAANGGGQVAQEIQPMSPNGFSSRRNAVREEDVSLDLDSSSITLFIWLGTPIVDFHSLSYS